MSFRDRDSTIALFPTSEAPRSNGQSAGVSQGLGSHRLPEFLVRPERAYTDWWGSVRLMFSRAPRSSGRHSNYPVSGLSVAGFRLSRPSAAMSSVVHLSLIVLLFYLPSLTRETAAPQEIAANLSEAIYYHLPPPNPRTRLPRVAPKGLGGRPGSGSLPALDPVIGRTASYGDVTVISKPQRPDNSRQTIIQPSSPPDLRIQTELKLPNIVLGNPAAAPTKPQINTEMSKPRQQNQQVAAETAPALTSINADVPLTSFERTNSAPRLPVGALATPAQRDNRFATEGSEAAPHIAGPQGDGALMILGVDPADAGSLLAIPPGNRLGEFSVSPGAGVTGTPGGTIEGHLNGGVGGSKGGGDEITTGIGPGARGGGGGNEGSSTGAVSISGSTGKGEGLGLLDPKFIATMVYPVVSAVKVRRNPMVVSAGSTGGGGLDAYGALKCARIYTIFLPMPGASWTMQYCQQANSIVKPNPDAPTTVVHLEPGLVPPDPDTDSRFDFKRLPVPPEKSQKLIVLKGMLEKDGTVGGLAVYQSIVPAMDEAARIAFSRWKFRPASLEGKPVAVEILVGIPTKVAGADPPPQTGNSPTP